MSVPENVLNKMQRERRGFDLFGKTEDPKIHNLILKGQKKVLKHFTDSRVLKRLSDSSLYGNEYYPNELIEDLTKAIFNKKKLLKINTLDQNLQNYYLKRLILIVKSKKYDSPSVSASLASLKYINSLTFSTSTDKSTQDHKEMIRWQLKEVLKL